MSNGLALPILNVFRLFSRMGPERLAATSTGAVPLDELLKHGVRGQPDVTDLPAALTTARVTHYRIDATHSNAFAAWHRLGSPLAPDQQQYDQLKAAGALATLADAPVRTPVTAGAATLHFALPRQAISLVVLEWE